MPVSTLKLHSQQPNGSVYADPLDPDYTVRFKTNSNPKTLDGQRTTNYVTEIIVNDLNDVTLGGKVTADALSVRIKVSGSIESIDKLKLMLQNVSDKLVTNWLGEDVLLGFQPVTAPVNGVV